MNKLYGVFHMNTNSNDTSRLDWLEQQNWDIDVLFELVQNWKSDGKRHGEGLRKAIDAMMEGENSHE